MAVISCLATDDIEVALVGGVLELQMLHDEEALAHISKQIAQHWAGDAAFDPEVGADFPSLGVGRAELGKKWEATLRDRIMTELGAFVQSIEIEYESVQNNVLKYRLILTPRPEFKLKQVQTAEISASRSR